ncbi:MAG TPA: hypothetical protein PKL29_08095 [Methanothrix sp.]|nr:hypothetical protein [Methanothrix sp.]
MRLLIGFMLLVLIIGIAESIQEGGANSGKVILLGSLSKNAINEANTANETNITNQSNITNPARGAVAIKNPMSTIPVSKKVKGTRLPNSIQANTIAYQFTT